MVFSTTLGFAQKPSFTGYVRNYTGVLVTGDYDYAIIQNTFDLKIEQSRDKVAFKANPYLYQYPDRDVELDLREVYLDIYFNSVDLRIGKQQIIWGKADGVFITDIVSPKDLSEFLLRDFDEIRVGITALKGNYYLGDNTFEIVWIPTFIPTDMPEDGSIWFPTMEFPIFPIFDYSKKEIASNLRNSETLIKYSALTSAVDFEIMAGYLWDDDPTLHQTRIFNPSSYELDTLIITPEHHRLELAGGSFSTTRGGFVIRGEGAYYGGKRFNSEDLNLPDGVIKKNYLHYLMGLDYTLWNTRLSFQFIRQAILGYDKAITNDEFENTITILAGKDFLRETLRLELFSYVGLNNSDALIRPKAIYDLAYGYTTRYSYLRRYVSL